jgi:LPS-assembly protein
MPSKQRWAFALTAIAAGIAAIPVHAQTMMPAQVPQQEVVPVPVQKKRLSAAEEESLPLVVEAQSVSGRPEREMTLEGDVDLVRGQTRVQADFACYRQVASEVDASGNIRLSRYGDKYTGDLLKLNLESGKGFMINPTYKMLLSNGQGKAERIDFLSEDEAVVRGGTYSTCEGPDPDWYVKSSTLNLDSGRDIGTAGATLIYFKDVPILGTPALSFSLSGARRSGWLPPTPGFSSTGGAELTVPYYFNIAPNRDLTLAPKFISRRGVQIGAKGRYIGETDAGSYAGETDIEFLLNDRESNTNRYLYKSQHTQTLAPGWTAGWNVRGVSDDRYLSDFSTTVANSAERQLLRELRTDYRTEFWSLSARAQGYQTLQDPAAAQNPALTVARPYDRLPQIYFNSARYDVGGGFDWTLDAELTRFWHTDLVRGNRLVVAPQVSYPFIGASYFVTPKVKFNASTYQLSENDQSLVPLQSQSLSRAIPTFSLDSGLLFERDTKLFGRAATQTLEPRLFYVYTPYRDQSMFPNFDTALGTFNSSQLFRENRFVGSDRISDANQLTAAVTSRFLEESGAERLRMTIGQRFYFSEQRVQLDTTTPVTDTRSDILLAASGRISENWGFDSAVQYNPSQSSVVSSNYSVQWRAGPKKVVNVAYRQLQDTIKNTDFSAQWPLSDRWYGVGRVSYSLRDKKVLESLGGLEYNGGCWIFRGGVQRFVTTANTVATSIFFQLELSGLSRLGVGSNALNTLTTTIPGYQAVNPGFSSDGKRF